MKKFRVIAVILAIVLVALICVFLLQDQSAPFTGDTIKVGVAVYRYDDTFITNMMNTLKEIVSAFERETGLRINLSIAYANGSQATQNEQIERFLSLDYDVLCVNIVDRTDASYIIDKVMEADIPVVFFNREPVQEDMQKWDRLFYVGTDASENGRLEGQIVADAYLEDPSSFDKNGDGILQYIMIEGEIRHQDAVLRTEGSVQTIRDAGIQVEKLDGGIGSWERSQGKALAQQFFTTYGDQIEVIICNNDDMALGVIDAVNGLGIDFHNIVGIDGTPEGLEAVRAGEMLGTVSINYEGQAKIVFDLAYALAVGNDPYAAVKVDEYRCARADMYSITMEDLLTPPPAVKQPIS